MQASPHVPSARHVSLRLGPVLFAGLLALPTTALLAQTPAPARSACTPGERVEVVAYGKWHPAVVVEVRTSDTYSPCRVHWIGYETTLDAWVPLSYLRAAGAGKAEPIPGGPKAFDATLDFHRSPRCSSARCRERRVGTLSVRRVRARSSGELRGLHDHGNEQLHGRRRGWPLCV